jgi:hypothetical protein
LCRRGLELLLSTDIRHGPAGTLGCRKHWSIDPFGGATVKLIQRLAM